MVRDNVTVGQVRGVGDLKAHPMNTRIYGEESLGEGFVESVRQKGVLVPLTIKGDGTIVSGHRRWQAARVVGLTTVPVHEVRFDSDLDEREAVIEFNRQRDKTFSQKMAEAEELEAIERERARERQEMLGRTHGDDPSGNHSGRGETRDLVADRVGIGTGRTYHKAKKVWQAAKTDDDIKAVVEKVDRGDWSISKAHSEVVSREKAAVRAEEMSQKSLEYREDPDKCRIIHGDFYEVCRTIEDNSIDHIITDPPYPQEYLPLWSQLSEVAVRVLKPGGFCIAYSGKTHLPDVINRLGEHLEYYWQVILLHSGLPAGVHPVKMNTCYKPILVFAKRPITPQGAYVTDVIKGTGREKGDHEWQQAEGEIAEILTRFTKPNDLILEPFAGSGTTLVGCIMNNRRCIGIEVDGDHVERVRGRVSSVLQVG